MKKIICSFFLLVLSISSAHSDSTRLSGQELSKLPDSVRSFVLFNRNVINKGGKGVKAVSFRDSEFRFAVTSIYDGKTKNPPVHMALVSSGREGATISFKTYKSCSPNDRLIDMVIRVDDKNVSSLRGCGPDPDRTGATQEIYIIKTQAGTDYIRRRFLENQYVFVDFGNDVVPFSSDGFDTLWDRAEAPAL